jgi:putative addiction module CopG family antidote
MDLIGVAMQINLPPELEPFVEQEFATGRYSSREEIVVQALRWLCEERREAVAGIKQGLDDAAAGRTQPVKEAFADLRREFLDSETE